MDIANLVGIDYTDFEYYCCCFPVGVVQMTFEIVSVIGWHHLPVMLLFIQTNNKYYKMT